MTFRVPIGTSAVVAIDPQSTVRVSGTVRLTDDTQITLAGVPTVKLDTGAQVLATLANGAVVNIGTMPAVVSSPLLAATPAGWNTAQRDAANALPALLAAHAAVADAFTLTGTTGATADDRLAAIVALIQTQVANILT